MKRSVSIRPVWAVGLVAGCLLISLSFTFRFAREELDLIRRGRDTLEQLRELRVRTEAPLRKLEARTSPLPEFPEESLRQAFPGPEVELGDETRQDLGSGVARRTRTVKLEGVSGGDLGRLMGLLENGSGWWITGLTLESAESGVRGEVTVEALDKAPSAP